MARQGRDDAPAEALAGPRRRAADRYDRHSLTAMRRPSSSCRRPAVIQVTPRSTGLHIHTIIVGKPEIGEQNDYSRSFGVVHISEPRRVDHASTGATDHDEPRRPGSVALHLDEVISSPTQGTSCWVPWRASTSSPVEYPCPGQLPLCLHLRYGWSRAAQSAVSHGKSSTREERDRHEVANYEREGLSRCPMASGCVATTAKERLCSVDEICDRTPPGVLGRQRRVDGGLQPNSDPTLRRQRNRADNSGAQDRPG